MRSVINKSWTKNTAFVSKGTARGKTRRWSIWCPKAFGMIGRKMDASTLERCIIIQMKKKLPTERAEKFRQEDNPEFDTLRRQCLRWTIEKMEAIKEAAARIPDGFGALENRAADNWTLQFAIAHVAGSDWPGLAQQAAAATAAAHIEDDRAVPIMLLADIKDAFEIKGVTKFHTVPLVTYLNALEGRTWGEWNNGRGLRVHQLANLLKGFDPPIRPPGKENKVRIGEVVLGGYRLEWFEDAFARYLSK
jgi:hypothetical protein